MIGQSAGLAALGWHQKHVQIAMSVACESKLFAITGPNGMTIPAIICRQRSGQAALVGNHKQVALMAKDDLISRGRDGGVAKPQFLSLGMGRGSNDKEQSKGDEGAGEGF